MRKIEKKEREREKQEDPERQLKFFQLTIAGRRNYVVIIEI